MLFFWILWGFDALIALVFLYFFAIGLADGSVSSFNMGLWLLILAVLAAVLLGSWQLVRHNQFVVAKIVLSVIAIPGFLYGLMVLMMMGVKDWK
jgi:hypothetical protein